METTIHVAEERHQAYITATKHAHLQEIENVRREAHNALQEQANRHAWETHVASTQADVARGSNMRELELALQLRGNEKMMLLAEIERDYFFAPVYPYGVS